MLGALLTLERPEVARVSCDECKAFLHDQNWQPIMRAGKKTPRPPNSHPPCFSCPKVPDEIKKAHIAEPGKITPQHAVEWTAASRQAWGHYWATKSGANPEQDNYSREMCGALERLVVLSTRRLQDPARLANELAGLFGK